MTGYLFKSQMKKNATIALDLKTVFTYTTLTFSDAGYFISYISNYDEQLMVIL